MARNEETLKALAEKMRAQHPGISDSDLLKLARAKFREEKARQTARKIISAQGAKARKERTRKMIQLGGLLEKAGLDSWDSDRLLGAFVALKVRENDSELCKRHKEIGADAFKTPGKLVIPSAPVQTPAPEAGPAEPETPAEPAKPVIKAPISGHSLTAEKKATEGK